MGEGTDKPDLGHITLLQEQILKEIDSLRYGDSNTPPTFGERLADKVVMFIGGWKFIIVQSTIIAIWIVINIIAYAKHWDPYPFILMNLLLSLEAAYASPLILMAQNRSDARDRRRAVDAYRSIDNIERMIKRLVEAINGVDGKGEEK